MTRMAFVLATLATLCSIACGSALSPVAPSATTGTSGAALVGPAAAMDVSATAAHGGGAPVGPVSEIVVDRGEFEYAGNSGGIRIYGSRGFSLSARVSGTSGVMSAVDACATNCSAGTVIPLTASWSGNDLAAVVTLDGVTYSDVGSLSGVTSAVLQIAGTAVAPPTGRAGRTVVTAPFTLVGEFMHASGAAAVQSDTLRGEGVAKVSLVQRAGGWTVESVTYKFKHQP